MSVFKLAIWDFSGRFANYVVTFAVSIVLARILDPEEFGIFGIVFAVIFLASIFLDFGFKSAVIQAERVSEKQLSTVFFLNALIGSVLTLLLIAFATFIERFFEVGELAKYLRAISPIFILNGLLVVPTGMLQRNLAFKKISVIGIASAVLAGCAAVVLAALGFGVWSLVASQLVNATVFLIGSFVFANWRPTLVFDIASVKPLWAFGSKLFLSTLLEVAFMRADIFVIAKLFDVITLGFYTRAQSLDQQFKSFSSSTIVAVMLPVFSQNQGDEETLRNIYHRSLNLISFVALAISGLCVLTAADIIVILFSEKWAPAAPYFRIMAAMAFVYPVSALMVNLISARGNSGAFLRLEIYKKIVLVPSYLGFLFGGITVFLAALAAAYVGALILNVFFVKKEIAAPAARQFWLIGRYVILAAISMLITFLVTEPFALSTYIHFTVSAILFLLAYIGLNKLFRTSGLSELTEKITDTLNDRRNTNLSSTS